MVAWLPVAAFILFSTTPFLALGTTTLFPAYPPPFSLKRSTYKRKKRFLEIVLQLERILVYFLIPAAPTEERYTYPKFPRPHADMTVSYTLSALSDAGTGPATTIAGVFSFRQNTTAQARAHKSKDLRANADTSFSPAKRSDSDTSSSFCGPGESLRTSDCSLGVRPTTW